MMDMLLFWVTLGFVVEAARMAVKKCHKGRKEQSKDNCSLQEPLLRPEDVINAAGHCTFYCCSHRLHENSAQYALKVEDSPETTSEAESDSLPGSIMVFTDDSEEDLLEQEDRIIQREDLMNSAFVTLVGDRRRSLKGKEIVEEQEDDPTDSQRPRSETSPSRIHKEGRRESNSAKIYPEPLVPPLTALQYPNGHFVLPGQISPDSSTRVGTGVRISRSRSTLIRKF